MGQESEDGVRKPGVCDHSPLPYSLGIKGISQSSSMLSANRCKRDGPPAFVGLTWD